MNTESWEMELEHEIEVLIDKETRANFCPKCNLPLKDNKCMSCDAQSKGGKTTEYYFDPDFDEYYSKVEREVEDFNDEISNSKWEEVPDNVGDIPSA